MIIEKIIMLQNCRENRNDHCISIAILKLNTQIKNYTMKQFLEYASISKTTMVRYMKKLEISEYTKFKEILYTEFSNRKIFFNATKYKGVCDFSSMTKGYDKIIILGGEERFSLCAYQSEFAKKGILLDIPINRIADLHYINDSILEKTLFIIISFNNRLDEYLDRSAFYYMEAKYLFLPSDSDIMYIGKKSNHLNDDIILDIEIKGKSTAQKIGELCSLFESLLKSI